MGLMGVASPQRLLIGLDISAKSEIILKVNLVAPDLLRRTPKPGL